MDMKDVTPGKRFFTCT